MLILKFSCFIFYVFINFLVKLQIHSRPGSMSAASTVMWRSADTNEALCSTSQVLAESNPSRFGVLWRRFDELYLLLDLLLQNHFLSHCSASFSENFYGLKRVSPGRGLSVRLGLNRKSHWRSLLLLCLVPYLRAKLEATLARQRDEEDFSIRLAQSRSQRLYRAAVAAYPYVSSAWRLWAFVHQLLFVFGFAKTHNPLLWLARVRLARLTVRDMQDMERKAGRPGVAADGRYSTTLTLNGHFTPKFQIRCYLFSD